MNCFIFPKMEFLSEAHENQSKQKRFIDATAATYKAV